MPESCDVFNGGETLRLQLFIRTRLI